MARTRAELHSSVAGYSRIVRWMKILLPLAAVFLIGAIFLFDRHSGEEPLFSPEDLATLGAGMQLENPRFAGVTEQGEPFVVTARSAVPDGPVPDMIELVEPAGEFTLSEDLTVKGRSTTGLMSRDDRKLTLNGRIVINTSEGHRAETEELIIDMEKETAFAPGTITAFGPEGSLTAGTMRAARRVLPDQDGKTETVILFENGVRVVFIPAEAR
ncbi:MAG: LPS export ABC transporter periplasmic protein LptC [Pseudomonadota bacterium]